MIRRQALDKRDHEIMLTLLEKGLTAQETADKLHCVVHYVEKFVEPEPDPDPPTGE